MSNAAATETFRESTQAWRSLPGDSLIKVVHFFDKDGEIPSPSLPMRRILLLPTTPFLEVEDAGEGVAAVPDPRISQPVNEIRL
jgi:hypothetical protein